MEKVNYYEVLGVGESATQEQIKKAFRKKAHVLHPDRNGSSAEANADFILLKLAYDILKDPEKRAEFDQYGSVDPNKKSTMDGARDTLINYFMAEVDKHVLSKDNGCPDINNTDIKAAIMYKIDENLMVLAGQRADNEKLLPKYQSAIKRIKSKNPIFLNSMNNKIESINKMFKSIDDAEKVNRAMIEMLEDFEYEFDEAEPVFAVHRTNPFYGGFGQREY